MEKRYQVFISSTFQDLQPARQEVSQALLRADCFPAGMELFPAADEEQFEFIKQIIDQSDYYIIISASHYGSIHPETGLSYTEMEYDYAVKTGKPVIRLLLGETEFSWERDNSGWERMRIFREKMRSSHLVRYWSNPKELGAEVTFGLIDIKKRFDAVGWVRAEPQEERAIAAPTTAVTNYPSNEKISKNIFLSYSFEDLRWADWISYQLKSFGHRVRRPNTEMSAGTNWQAWISEAIASSDTVVSIISENQSPNVMFETGIAIAMSDSKKIIPIVIKPTKIPIDLAGLQRLDLSVCNEEEARAILFRSLSGVPTKRLTGSPIKYQFPGID